MMNTNDLLDMSKIESGNLTIENKSFSVSELMKSSLSYFFKMLRRKKSISTVLLMKKSLGK